MIITIEVIRGNLPVKDIDETEIRYILMDALHEFQENRIGIHGSARNYVASRYSKDTYPDGPRFEAKVNQVSRRCLIAEILRCSIVTLKE